MMLPLRSTGFAPSLLILLPFLCLASAAAARYPMVDVDLGAGDWCEGSADYEVTFENLMYPERNYDAPGRHDFHDFHDFHDLHGREHHHPDPDHPEYDYTHSTDEPLKVHRPYLVFSPLLAVSHSGRLSILTDRGYASQELRDIAQTGDNSALYEKLSSMQADGHHVLSVSTASAPTGAGERTTLKLTVDCHHPYISVVAMIAPSPDWIVHVANLNMHRSLWFISGFRKSMSGYLYACDAGTDDGTSFTDPSDPSLDIPSDPQLNIAPLRTEPFDPFHGQDVGQYEIRRVASYHP